MDCPILKCLKEFTHSYNHAGTRKMASSGGAYTKHAQGPKSDAIYK